MVSLDSLDQDDHLGCVLSQMTGMDYSGAVNAYGLTIDQESYYGFDIPSSGEWDNEEATDCWKQEILKRRNHATTPSIDNAFDKARAVGLPVTDDGQLAVNLSLATGLATFNGVLKVGGKEINIPDIPLAYVLTLAEANK